MTPPAMAPPVANDFETKIVPAYGPVMSKAGFKAERDLMEWKKVKFMENRVGEEFDAQRHSSVAFR